MAGNGQQGACLKLFISIDGGEEQVAEISGKEIFVGAGKDNTVQVMDSKKTVSRKHLRIFTDSKNVYAEDLASTNGSFLGGKNRRMPPNKPVLVREDEPVWLGPNVRLRIKMLAESPRPSKPLDKKTTIIGKPSHEGPSADEVFRAPRRLEIPTGRSVILGRELSCDITINHPQVSRQHAKVTLQPDGFVLEDLGSTNGTFVNGKRISRALMKEGDVLGVGPVSFTISPKMGAIVEEKSAVEGMRLDARGLTRVLKDGCCILPPTDLTILPGEFMGILGASGSGKTTLMTMLNGSVIPSDGYVWLNGLELVKYNEYLKQHIGYVPQYDIIHSELSVSEILYYAARLRLPKDLSKEEIESLIAKTLGIVGLSDKWGANFQDLSGGERKRVNMAVELIIDPQIFFLDEPTSGLDPGMERDVMELFERYAQSENKTVVMVTHVTQNISVMDKLIILEKGGNTAFFGTPDEALDFFAVNDFVEIYKKIERTKPKVWSGKYDSSDLSRKYKYAHQRVEEEVATERGELKEEKKGILQRLTDWGRQLTLLTARYARIMIKDTRNLLTLLLQAPIVAIFSYLVFQGIHNIAPGAFPPKEIMLDGLIFILVLAAIWFGVNNSVREISKEQSVYRRERMVFLKIAPYLFSKFIILALVCLFQTGILVLMVKGMVGFEGNLFHVWLMVFLTALSGVTLGLFISSVAKSTNMAVSLVPIVLIPQIIFSGLIRPVEDMDRISQGISKACVAYWSFSATKEITVGRNMFIVEEVEKELPKKDDMTKGIDQEKIKEKTEEIFANKFRREVTYADYKRNLIIVGVFMVVFFILAYLALLAKEKRGFENR